MFVYWQCHEFTLQCGGVLREQHGKEHETPFRQEKREVYKESFEIIILKNSAVGNFIPNTDHTVSIGMQERRSLLHTLACPPSIHFCLIEVCCVRVYT